MFILYLVESGYHASAEYFVLAGIAVFERETYWYAQDMDALQQRYLPSATGPVEFHVSSLRAKRQEDVPEPFNQLDLGQRRELIARVYQRSARGALRGCV